MYFTKSEEFSFVTLLSWFQWSAVRRRCLDCGPGGSRPSFGPALVDILDQKLSQTPHIILFMWHHCQVSRGFSHFQTRLSLQVKLHFLLDKLVSSRTTLKSPDIILILLTCPLLQEEENIENHVLKLALVISGLDPRCQTALGKHIVFLCMHLGLRSCVD